MSDGACEFNRGNCQGCPLVDPGTMEGAYGTDYDPQCACPGPQAVAAQQAVIKAARELLATSTVSGPHYEGEARADVCVAALCNLKASLDALDGGGQRE